MKCLTDKLKLHAGMANCTPVMDCFGGEIISLAMDGNMKKELRIKAAKEGYMLRKPKSGFLFHSDAARFLQFSTSSASGGVL
ncbi:hypothetical protein [Treponema succinifaciens]|uniref:hypothetical protein n=1 Tax=Treponema succinifaciens TaxID=167 RepID=UPI0023F24624|nr:hypothetical protein [Treponema succinifaciens]